MPRGHQLLHFLSAAGISAPVRKGMSRDRQLLRALPPGAWDWDSSIEPDERWKGFVGFLPAPAFIADARGSIEFANDAFLKLSGYSLVELIGRDPSMFISGLTTDEAHEDMWGALIAGRAWSGELRNRRKDGSLYWGSVNITHIPDSAGSISHLLCVINDITRQKEAEARCDAMAEQLRQRERMSALGAAASCAAHDFNNVLAIIAGFAHAGLNDLPSGSPICSDFRSILAAVDRGQVLARRILMFSRQAPVKHEPLDLKMAIADALKMARAAIPTQITIRKSFPTGPVRVRGDATEWHQVITNLCVNAAQAIGGRPGEIELELRLGEQASGSGTSNPPAIELIVKDTGDGIAPSDLGRIFDPFYSTKRPGEGSGLGLAIVHAIVSGCGGRIWAENRPSGGAAIHIEVPKLLEAERLNPVASTVEGRQAARNTRPTAPSRRAGNRAAPAALAPTLVS